MDNLTSDIVEQLVQRVDNKLRVISVSPLVNGVQTVVFCDVKYLALYNRFLSGEQVLTISGNSVEVETSTAFQVGDIVELPIPLFMHGTPYNTVQEWHDHLGHDERTKLPFIWLVTPTSDNNQDFRSAIKRIAGCQIFFVHWSNWVELNQNRVNDAIRPLTALKNEFIKACNRSPQIIDKLDGHQTKEYPKFGRESNKGVEEVIYNSTLAAVRIELDLRIKDFKICEC